MERYRIAALLAISLSWFLWLHQSYNDHPQDELSPYQYGAWRAEEEYPTKAQCEQAINQLILNTPTGPHSSHPYVWNHYQCVPPGIKP